MPLVRCAVLLVPLLTAAVARAETQAPAVDPDYIAPAASLAPERVQGLQQRLLDWPGLARYRDDNARLPAHEAGRVVFYGDSITDGWGRVADTTFFPGKPYVNRGISGQTTAQMLVRFRQDVIALNPEVVVILAGTNDIAGNTGPATQRIRDLLNIGCVLGAAVNCYIFIVQFRQSD